MRGRANGTSDPIAENTAPARASLEASPSSQHKTETPVAIISGVTSQGGDGSCEEVVGSWGLGRDYALRDRLLYKAAAILKLEYVGFLRLRYAVFDAFIRSHEVMHLIPSGRIGAGQIKTSRIVLFDGRCLR
jgi:hypothetical protein